MSRTKTVYHQPLAAQGAELYYNFGEASYCCPSGCLSTELKTGLRAPFIQPCHSPYSPSAAPTPQHCARLHLERAHVEQVSPRGGRVRARCRGSRSSPGRARRRAAAELARAHRAALLRRDPHEGVFGFLDAGRPLREVQRACIASGGELSKTWVPASG